MTPERTIEIAPEVFGCGFDVAVLPESSFGRELPTYVEARAYAEKLHAAHGLRIVDNCPGRLAVLP